MINILQNIINFFYPKTCFWCEKISQNNPCKKCEIELKNFLKVKIDYKNEYKHIYLCKYNGKIRKKILDFKFGEKPYLKEGFANLIIKNEKMCLLLSKYDIIIPVPIHKKREKERGYNQSELIVKEIVKKYPEIELIKDVLIKEKNVKPQSLLNSYARKQNVIGVYSLNNK